ncbi:MAG: hypothetical protein IPM98_18045 [Lewinellaceae bacterium]|nr:hypothetical protein [Lewinellaceae bacterium]
MEDKLKPTASCPNNSTVSCTNQVPAVDVSSVTTSDNCGGTVTVTHIGDVPNGTCPTTISRTYQAEDACGNTERCTQTITVEDKLKPAVSCPSNSTVSCTNQVPAVDVSSVTTSDNCGGTVTVTHIGDVPNGTCPTTISRTYQAEDACGNTERCTQTITVEDKLKPIIVCRPDLQVSCIDQVPPVDVSSVTTSDNCGGSVTVTHISDVPNGTCPTTISRTYQAEDACGNTERCTQTITVEDKLKPIIVCRPDLHGFPA